MYMQIMCPMILSAQLPTLQCVCVHPVCSLSVCCVVPLFRLINGMNRGKLAPFPGRSDRLASACSS